MEWIWELYKDYISKFSSGSQEDIQNTFFKTLSESSITVLVQEPWQNTVRFKGLAKYSSKEMMDLIKDPENYLLKQFGGGKFKLNFHHGWNFVGTKNFKPAGEPRWKDMPGIDF